VLRGVGTTGPPRSLNALTEGDEELIRKGSTRSFLAAPSGSPLKPLIIINLLSETKESNHLRKEPQMKAEYSPSKKEKSFPLGEVIDLKLGRAGKSKTL